MPTYLTKSQGVLPSILEKQVTELVGATPLHARVITSGLTVARRWIVEFDNGTKAFLKAAGNSATAAWLRTEYKVYKSLTGPHLPKLIGWSDQPPGPFLLLEDLSNARWPPPWSPQEISLALEAIKTIHASTVKLNLPPLESQYPHSHNWQRLAADSGPFLALRLCSSQWLERVLPDLIAAEKLATLAGEDLVHGDFKSGNICFDGNRAILIDWNWAAIGNGLMDIATWLPGLAQETGSLSESILPGQAPLAALVAGNLAYWSAQPPPADLPRLRESQLQRLTYALDWACRELSLPSMACYPQ